MKRETEEDWGGDRHGRPLALPLDLSANGMPAATHRSDLERGDMAWSLDQDGVLTQFDEGTKRVKQIDHQRGGRVRFSRQRFQDEAAATAAFSRQKVTFDLWPPLILPKDD